MHIELDHCFVSIYNRVVVTQVDPVGLTSVHIAAKPGYVLGHGLINVEIPVRDARDATEADRI